MRKVAKALAEANAELDGALENTPTWNNEKAKGTPGKDVGALIKRTMGYVLGFRPVRAFQRYTVARGALLSGGIAYSALFAIAGALTIAFTALSVFLGSNQQLFDRVIEQINAALPGILQTDSNPEGLIAPSTLVVEQIWNPATIVALVVLLWSALSLMTALRTSIQAMFGISKMPVNFVFGKLLDLSAFVILVSAVLVTVVLTSAAAVFTQPVFEFLGMPASWGNVVVTAVSLALGLMVDAGVFIFLFRVLSSARAKAKDLIFGGLVGGLGTSVIRYLGTAAVSSVSDNPLLASFASLATLLLWVNLVARITLIAAAFTANPPEQMALQKEYFEHADETPNFVTKSALRTLAWNYDPVMGVLVADAGARKEQEIPQWHGLGARFARRKLNAAKAELRTAVNTYESAKAEFDARAVAAYRRRRKPSTNAKITGEKYAVPIVGKAPGKHSRKPEGLPPRE
ncbi:MAG: YihY/virulence factor BrkB family protein [Actinomycetaceae bacterium]|nr:YihY/virulence factor BrkB family protein [Arcanobacterium sp.]MDD7504343.1 YihY/virulence factor BrkB family protein [Actinomycetaceae bacterium]MDY6143007.1 YihY/virulence factor BrkB family protein [Arcanobacterium sp.]